MPSIETTAPENNYEQAPPFSSIRTTVSPLLERIPIEVEPTPVYTQKKSPVYPDKFKDRSPWLPGAGLLPGPEEDNVNKLIRGTTEDSMPSNVKKFHDYYFTPYEQRRIHYGQINDKERQIALDRVHGLPSKQFDSSKELLNPPTKSFVEQHLARIKEAHVYHSTKNGLGKAPKPNLPENIDVTNFAFGHTTVKGERGGDAINPRKSTVQVEWEDQQCKDLYRLSHSAYYPGEQKHRDYPCFNAGKMFGRPTPNDPTGGKTKQAMDWITDCLDRKGQRIESERLINYRERFSHQLGKVRDPIADTMAVDPVCYAFGLPSKGDQYKASHLIHQRVPKEWLRGHWNRRNAIISEVRRQLKKHSWTNFEQFLNICLNKDKYNCESLSNEEMRSIFKAMGVPLEPEVLEQLLDLCDVGVISTAAIDCAPTTPIITGRINYREMICILNWTDRTVGDAKTVACSKHDSESSETLAALEKKIDSSITDYQKSSSAYGAHHDVGTSYLRKFGVPSRRVDLPAPRLRKLDDRQNYGDEPGAGSLIRPSIMNRYGISERDVFMPRSKTEIKTILSRIGVDMSEADFDAIWDRAQLIQSNGGKSVNVAKSVSLSMTQTEGTTLSFEAFRAVLDEIMANKISQGQLYV